MKALLILIGLFFTMHCLTLEPDEKALSFYSIKNYAKAKEIYQEMLTKPLPAWEKAFVQYNLGTILLAEGRWDESKNQFDEITLGKDPSPLLLRYLNTNMSVNTIRQAYALFLMTSLDIKKIEWLLNTSLKKLEEAQQADCAFTELEETEKKTCIPPQDLTEMTKIVSQLLFQIHESKRQAQFKNLTTDQRIFLLIDEIQQATHNIQLLNQVDNPMLKESYQTYFSALLTSHMDLWESINEQAYNFFEEGNIALKQGDLEKSSLLLNKSAKTLKEIQDEKIRANPLTQNLEELLFRFSLLLAQNPIDINALTALEQDQNKILPDSLSSKFVSLSLDFLKTTEESTARFFLLEASFQTELSILKIDPSPISILEKLIVLQKHALMMNTSYQNIENKPENARALLIENQQIPVQQANDFFTAALLQQTLSFQKEDQCQWQPWDKVFPLFDQGFSQASLAVHYLSKPLPELINAMQAQDQAIKKWEESLKGLKNPLKNPQKAPEQMPQQNQDLLNLVQEMELQDRTPTSKKPLKSQEGVRPW